MIRCIAVETLRERFGKYHVLDKLAQGGMAEVYKVKTVGIAGFEKLQALKRILPHSAREARFIRSFIDEARIAVELTHRNIVQVFDFGKAEGELFMAMELIEGKDLRTALAEGIERDLLPSVAVSAYVINEVAQGLDYAHRKTDGYGGSLGIVHCDVSPANVMLADEGYVKILDFGIARASFSSALERRRLRGKPRYMAPEQTYGEVPTAAADVFALGIIAWEMFTGQQLFRGNDVKTILDQVRRTQPPRIDEVVRGVPREIVDGVAMALHREPAQRGTTADLAAACARTALGAGSRAVAEWLEDLAARPTMLDLSAHSAAALAGGSAPPPDHGIPFEDMPPDLRPSMLAMAVRPSAREVTGSIADLAIPASAPTPWGQSEDAPWRREPTEGLDERPSAVIVPLASRREPTLALDERESANLVSSAPMAARSFDEEATEYAPPGRRHRHEPNHDEPDASGRDVTGDPIDDLIAELAPPIGEPTGEPADEPIDDAPPTLISPVGALDRRRAVIVCGLVRGGDAEAQRATTRLLGELAYQRGGAVIALDDAALVIAFGIEVAGEDDSASAVGWARDAAAFVHEARDRGARGAITLHVGMRSGVGVTTGRDGVVVAPADLEQVRTLAREAAPGQPNVAGPAGARPPRALAEALAGDAMGDEAITALPSQPGALPATARPFIGRSQQLTGLEMWFSRALAGDRRLAVLVTGGAGVGKTRLVQELVARRIATGRPLRTVIAAASPGSHLSPFALVIELYQAALELPSSRGRAARAQLAQRLTHMLTKAGVAAERVRAVVTDLDRAMELRDGVGIGAAEAADLRPRISAGFALVRIAMGDRTRPQLTIVEDIHHADSASLEVLRHVLTLPATGPELLVLTTSDDAAPGAWRPATDAVIAVGDLVGGELRAFVADRLGPAATPMNIAAVLARGGGNPVEIEELARAVREGSTAAVMPASAAEVVAARLVRVSPGAAMLVKAAAVLGDQVRLPLLVEVMERGDELDAELDELVEGNFLVRTERDATSGEHVVTFTHDLVRDVVYASIPDRALAESHAKIGRLLASRFFAGREEPPAEIAEHLERGGELPGAAAFWLRAGRLAYAASDAPGAVVCFTRTLALEARLGGGAPSPTSRARRREAIAGREEAHRLLGDLATNADDIDELQRLCLGEPARLADVAIRRAQRLLRLGDCAGASAATTVAEGHAVAAGDERLQGEALRVRGEVFERLGRFDDALAVVAVARELFHRQHSLADEMAAMVGRGRIHLLRAHYVAARDAYRPVLALIETTGDPWLERIVTNHVAVIEMCLGNFERAMALAQRSLELCRRYGDRTREGDGLSVAGIVLLEVGQLDAAAAMFGDALAVLGATTSRWSRTDCLIYAGVCELRRRTGRAITLLDEAVAEARSLGARYLEANALIARSEVHLTRGALADALADAAAGTAAAQDATLLGYEIQGLARQALITSRLGGRGEEAAALVTRAMELLEEQVTLEGSEEVVFAACVETLRAAGHADRAQFVAQRGRASAQRKLDAMRDPAWRLSYAALPEIRFLLGT